MYATDTKSNIKFGIIRIFSNKYSSKVISRINSF